MHWYEFYAETSRAIKIIKNAIIWVSTVAIFGSVTIGAAIGAYYAADYLVKGVQHGR